MLLLAKQATQAVSDDEQDNNKVFLYSPAYTT